MDSSRSGLLSTLLMTLPLIVVPAIALLRPPGSPASLSTTALDAADESELDDDLGSLSELFDDEPTDRDARKNRDDELDLESPFYELPDDDEHRNSVKPERRAQRETNEMPADPFMDEPKSRTAPDDTDPQFDPGSDEKNSAADIEKQLNSQGALRTLWFDAGERTPVGLAVFFRGQTDLTRIRFEAVGQSRDACAKDVLGQVNEWQAAEKARQN